jgi:hypothetical protein
MRQRSAFALFLLMSSAAVRANLPLTVEDIISDKGKLRLELSIAYANVDRQGISTGAPIIVQTGPTSFVALPTAFGESVGNTDTWVTTAGLRYGLSANAEIYGRLSALHSTLRNAGLMGTSSNTDKKLVDTWAGINYQFTRNENTPALLGFAELALHERHREKSASFKSAMLGLTAYHALDPVVFSLTAAYRFNRTRNDGAQVYRPGNLLLINPALAFAVNDRVTLTTGTQWTRRAADHRAGQAQGIDRTATDLLLGVGYSMAKGNTLNHTLKVNASGRSGAEMRMSWLYTF